MGGGCAFFDYDNDGWMDIFILGGRHLEAVPPGASNRLYHNNRDGTFTDVTDKAGLRDAGWANGICVGDYDNDGFEDLFLTYFGQNRLYHNRGDGTFADVTEKSGLFDPQTRFNSGCTFLDYNRDGHLDLFVSNYVEFDMAHAPRPSLAARMVWALPRTPSTATMGTEPLPMSPRSPAFLRCAAPMGSRRSLSTLTRTAGPIFSWPVTRPRACC
jgi:hypothetical protein